MGLHLKRSLTLAATALTQADTALAPHAPQVYPCIEEARAGRCAVGKRRPAVCVLALLGGAFVVVGCAATTGGRDDSTSYRPVSDAGVPENWRRALASDDVIKVIRTLHALAEAGPAAREAEADIAALLTKTARGKHLSRWAYHALTKVSERAERFTDKYLAAAGWTYCAGVVPLGEVGEIGGPIPPELYPPRIPEDLRSASRCAWATAIEAAIPALLRALQEQDRRGAQLAEDALQYMGAPPDVIVPRLAEVLNRQALGRARWTAAYLIGECGATTEDMKPLLSWVDDPDPGVRTNVLRSLGRIVSNDICHLHDNTPGDASSALAAGALVKALSDPEPEVRRSAAGGLRLMGHRGRSAADALVAALRNDPTEGPMGALAGIAQDLRGRDAEAFAEVARKAVPAIVSILRAGLERDGDRQLAKRAAYHLGAFGGTAAPGVPHLRRVLRDHATDKDMTAAAIQSLGSIGSAAAEAVPDILAALEPWQEKQEKYLERYRGMPRGTSIVRQVLSSFRGQHGNIGWLIALSLGRIGHGGGDVEKALLSLTRDMHSWTRREAATALGIVGRDSQEVIRALESLLQDEAKEVREVVPKALRAIRARAAGVEAEDAQDVF